MKISGVRKGLGIPDDAAEVIYNEYAVTMKKPVSLRTFLKRGISVRDYDLFRRGALEPETRLNGLVARLKGDAKSRYDVGFVNGLIMALATVTKTVPEYLDKPVKKEPKEKE